MMNEFRIKQLESQVKELQNEIFIRKRIAEDREKIITKLMVENDDLKSQKNDKTSSRKSG